MLANLRTGWNNRKGSGAVDLVIVIATIILAFVVLGLPVISRPVSRSPRISCVSNLKQAALAARIWSNDHGDMFPWAAPMSTNGVKELAMSGNVAALFLSMSNEIASPKVLTCPADSARKREVDFSKLRNKNISYFVGLDADEAQPRSVLFGDRNILGGVMGSNRVIMVSATNVMTWGSDIHRNAGNIALGDGSAQQVSSKGLQNQFQSQFQAVAATNWARFALP